MNKPIISKSCGASFHVASGITLLLEISLSVIVGALCVMSWIKTDKPSSFIYTAPLKDNYIIRNKSLENCVILWCLSVAAGICIWRVLSAVILFFCVKNNSASMGQYWIAYKILALMLSVFVGIASLTVPAIRIATISSLVVDVVTCYFIVLLYPELDRMERTITIVPAVSKSKPEALNETNFHQETN